MSKSTTKKSTKKKALTPARIASQAVEKWFGDRIADYELWMSGDSDDDDSSLDAAMHDVQEALVIENAKLAGALAARHAVTKFTL